MDTTNVKELTDALKIYVKPSCDRHLDETFNETSIELDWKIVSFEYDTLILQVNFKHVLEISPDEVQDSIVIGLKPGYSNALVATDLGQRLDSDFHELEFKIPK